MSDGGAVQRAHARAHRADARRVQKGENFGIECARFLTRTRMCLLSKVEAVVGTLAFGKRYSRALRGSPAVVKDAGTVL